MRSEIQRDDRQQLAQLLAQSVADQLRDVVQKKDRAVLVVSGGTTPVAFFQALSHMELPWARVSITLADERWLDSAGERSNEKLVRDHLLKNQAQQAYFLGLKNNAPTPSEGIMECETNLRTQNMEPDIVVLGMGEDGHTASWFPGCENLQALTDIKSSAWCLPVEDDFLAEPRMSLSWRLLSKAQQIYLHFNCEGKNAAKKSAVYQQASQQYVPELPVSLLLNQQQVPVFVYYS